MKVLQIVKTTQGGLWAAAQVAELVRRGVDVHVALPPVPGQVNERWRTSGATLHHVSLDLPHTAPWQIPAVLRAVRALVADVKPDIIHSYAVGTTMVLRHALGPQHPTPRVFQVLGPLHLEGPVFSRLDVKLASAPDHWIAGSRCVFDLLIQAGAPSDRVFLSYPGMTLPAEGMSRTGVLRRRLGIGDEQVVVGNINYLYAPKRLLGHTRGVKNHEDVIAALAIVFKARTDVVGVLAGGPWNGALAYEQKLHQLASRVAGPRLLMPGLLTHDEVISAWADYDCAVHIPISENMGGVLEPLLMGVPIIAGRVGALGELVIDGVTGTTVPNRDPEALAEAILGVLGNPSAARGLAEQGRALARAMFDARRTSAEIWEIYQYLLDATRPRPVGLDSHAYLARRIAADH